MEPREATRYGLQGTMLGAPEASLMRVWYARESIQNMLRSLGLPTTMDSTHVLFRGGMHGAVRYMLASSDEQMFALLNDDGPKYHESVAMFTDLAGPMAIRHLMTPGLTLSYHGASIDGVAMEITFSRKTANEGPKGYIIPVERLHGETGQEYNELVAMISREAIDDWRRVMTAASAAGQMRQADGQTLRCFNGPSVHIQAVSLDDIVMDESITRSFVGDINAFLSRRDWYRQRKLAWTRRYILNGPPGTGKTTLARWAATNLGLPAVSFDFSDQYADGRDFSQFLSYCSRIGPTVCVLDDLEKVLDGQNSTRISKRDIMTSLSGVGCLDGLILVATSNSMDAFNGPMRRRFDKVIEVGLPGPEARKRYIEKMLGHDIAVWTSAELEMFVRSTNNMSIDDIRAVVTAAAGSAISDGADIIRASHIELGLREASRVTDAK